MLRSHPLFLLDKRNDPEEDDGADNGGDNLAHKGAAPVDSEPAEDVAANEAADDSDEEVNPETKAGPFHNLACQKTGQCTDKNRDDDTHNLCFSLVYNCSRNARRRVMWRW